VNGIPQRFSPKNYAYTTAEQYVWAPPFRRTTVWRFGAGIRESGNLGIYLPLTDVI